MVGSLSWDKDGKDVPRSISVEQENLDLAVALQDVCVWGGQVSTDSQINANPQRAEMGCHSPGWDLWGRWDPDLYKHPSVLE